MARETKPPVEDTGRMGFRYEHEAPDGRPVIVWTDPPLDPRYLRAVRLAPREQYMNLKPSEYIMEIAKLANGLETVKPLRGMPEIESY